MTKKTVPPVSAHFRAAQAGVSTKPPARPPTVPDAIKRHKPAMNGPKPPAGVAAAVQRSVREQREIDRSKQRVAAPQLKGARPPRRQEFNARAAGPLAARFNRHSRGR